MGVIFGGILPGGGTQIFFFFLVEFPFITAFQKMVGFVLFCFS